MKVFYSILSTSIRSIANEQLSIGLIMCDSAKTYFHFSADKLNLVRKLYSEPAFLMVKSYLEGLEADIAKSTNSDLRNLTQANLNYLSDYCNNLITFSKPAVIDVALAADTFEMLFEKFVFKYEKNSSNRLKVRNRDIEHIKNNLYPKIETHVNLNTFITQKEAPNLIIPKVKVDFIGRNGIPVVGEAINFEATTNRISNQLSRFVSLIKAFELDNEKGKYFVIGNEPVKNEFPEQHATWASLVRSNLVEFVSVNDMECVADYMSVHNVHPFFEG